MEAILHKLATDDQLREAESIEQQTEQELSAGAFWFD